MAHADLPAAMRDRNAPSDAFRKSVRTLAPALTAKLKRSLGKRVRSGIVLVVILRSGVALLDAALLAFPTAQVAVVGLKRDETTARARWYYENIPPLKNKTVVILDPMLATGGTAAQTARRLKQRGAKKADIFFLGVVAAPEGVRRLARHLPSTHILVQSVDSGLDARKYIVPGLGDFGDRYFGYKN